jgi:hypothetical protein
MSVWRRLVLLKYKPDAGLGAMARSVNIHHSFERTMPSVLHSCEGFTFTSGQDGGGAYPGEHNVNRGFHSAVDMVVATDTPEGMAGAAFWNHPAHVAAGTAVGPLVESSMRMDWLEDRGSLVVPSPAQSYVKHIVFFEFDGKATAEHKSALLEAWRGLPAQMPEVLGVSCGLPVPWTHGHTHGFSAGICADIALESSDGIAELNAYHTHPAFQAISKELLKPIRKPNFVVMDLAFHASSGSGE